MLSGLTWHNSPFPQKDQYKALLTDQGGLNKGKKTDHESERSRPVCVEEKRTDSSGVEIEAEVTSTIDYLTLIFLRFLSID